MIRFAVASKRGMGGLMRALIAFGLLILMGIGSTAIEAQAPLAVTEAISTTPIGAVSIRGGSHPAITPDGRFVVFASDGADIVPGDTNIGNDIFLRDRSTGQTEIVSVATDGSQGLGTLAGIDYGYSISTDGNFVVFAYSHRGLSPADQNDDADVFVRDRINSSTELISVDATGQVAAGRAYPWVSMSADGRFVAFVSDSPNMGLGGSGNYSDIYVRDRLTSTTKLVSVGLGGSSANSYSARPEISGDGRFIAFWSMATNLVASDGNGTFEDLYLRDLVNETTELVSVSSTGEQGDNNGTLQFGSRPALSFDGRYVAFSSTASNLVPGTAPFYRHVFRRDLSVGVTALVSVSATGDESTGTRPGIDPSGRFVAFEGPIGNLVPYSPHNQSGIFLKDMTTGAVEVAGVSTAGVQAREITEEASVLVGTNGRFVGFTSQDPSLWNEAPSSPTWDVFLRDRGVDTDDDGIFDWTDSCIDQTNVQQWNSDQDFADNSPPYGSGWDDLTVVNSDVFGDECDLDDDNDGISDSDEASGMSCNGTPTDPRRRDSDGDRALDGAECAIGTNPANSETRPTVEQCAAQVGVGSRADTDHDRLRDFLEFCFYNSNTESTDSDGDASLGGGSDGCEATSFNRDRIVNVVDMAMLAAAISHAVAYHVNIDVNKDGVLNPADQGLVASFISPAGQCP